MTVHIKKVIKDIISKKSNLINKREEVFKILQNILDQRILNSITAIKFYKNKLIIYVNSSACLYQLSLLKKNILSAIQNNFNEIEDIKYKIG